MAGWNIYTITEAIGAAGLSLQNLNGYRPLQWALSGLSNDPSQLIYAKTNIGGFFFDAILRTEHISSLRITEHPVQDGASLSDHAFKMPEVITLEIGMSDAMDSFIPGQFGTGGANILNNLFRLPGLNLIPGMSSTGSKSINAFKTLKSIQAARIPLTVVTRLDIYKNMLIEHIAARDDFKTATGLRAIATLKQIIIGQLATTTVDSDRPQTTETTSKGAVQAEAPGSAASGIEDYIPGAGK